MQDINTMLLHLPDSSIAIFSDCRHALRPRCDLHTTSTRARSHVATSASASAQAVPPASCPRSPTSPAFACLPSPARAAATTASSQYEDKTHAIIAKRRVAQYIYVIMITQTHDSHLHAIFLLQLQLRFQVLSLCRDCSKLLLRFQLPPLHLPPQSRHVCYRRLCFRQRSAADLIKN